MLSVEVGKVKDDHIDRFPEFDLRFREDLLVLIFDPDRGFPDGIFRFLERNVLTSQRIWVLCCQERIIENLASGDRHFVQIDGILIVF